MTQANRDRAVALLAETNGGNRVLQGEHSSEVFVQREIAVIALMRSFDDADARVEAARAEARNAEKVRIADAIDYEASVTPCEEDAKVVRDIADLVRADFSYDEAERLAGLDEAVPSPYEAARQAVIDAATGWANSMTSLELRPGVEQELFDAVTAIQAIEPKP